MLENARSTGLSVYIAIAPFLPCHGEVELLAVVSAIRRLEPVEVFDEVLNPRSENLDMMREALLRAGRSEIVPEDYRQRWPRFTFQHLRAAHNACVAAGIGDRFIAWPDPVTTRSLALAEEERAWLKGWIPTDDEMVVGASVSKVGRSA